MFPLEAVIYFFLSDLQSLEGGQVMNDMSGTQTWVEVPKAAEGLGDLGSPKESTAGLEQECSCFSEQTSPKDR